MPLTPAHPAVVLSLQRLGLPLSALVVGAVAPDATVYLPVGVSHRTTHSGWGIGVDTVIGLVLLRLWFPVVRDAVVDLTWPLRARLPAQARLDGRDWLLAPVAIAIGAATHVLWDSTTHDWGFVVRDLRFLHQDYRGLPLYRWLQHLSTLSGTAIVATYGLRGLRRRPETSRDSAVSRPRLWLLPVLVAALVVGLLFSDPEAGVGAALLSLLAVAIGWRAVRRREA